MHRFKKLRVYLYHTEAPWKELHQLLDQSPSTRLRECIETIMVVGEQYDPDHWAVLGPQVLGITPSRFPGLTTLYMVTATLPSVKHLVAFALSLPSLQDLDCRSVTYTATLAVPPHNQRWYSCPVALELDAPPAAPGPKLKTLKLVDATWTDGEPWKAASNLVTCFMEAKLHLDLESLTLFSTHVTLWPAPSWVPLVRACAPNLYKLTISFGPPNIEPGVAAPPFFDALRALPRLRILKLHYEAVPLAAQATESDNPFVPVFVLGTLKLVRQTPVPFPQLEDFQLFYGRSNIPDAEQPLFYPAGTEDALHAILRHFLAERRIAMGVPGQRHYPCLKRFGFCVTAPQRLREAHNDELERLEKELLETSGKSLVRVEVFADKHHSANLSVGRNAAILT